MFDVAPTELLLVAVVALVVIGPKDLPHAMRIVGRWVARAQGVARHFRSGLDEMVRQAELEELERKWAAENARIMREHPPEGDAAPDLTPAPEMRPLPAPAATVAFPADPARADAIGGPEPAGDDAAGATPPRTLP